jgi:hypothetical protein
VRRQNTQLKRPQRGLDAIGWHVASRIPVPSPTGRMPRRRTQEFKRMELNGIGADGSGFHRLGKGGLSALTKHSSERIDLCERRPLTTTAPATCCTAVQHVREHIPVTGPFTMSAESLDPILMHRGMPDDYPLSHADCWQQHACRTFNRVPILSNLDGANVQAGSMHCGRLEDLMPWTGAWRLLPPGSYQSGHLYKHLRSPNQERHTSLSNPPKGLHSEFIHQSSILDP